MQMQDTLGRAGSLNDQVAIAHGIAPAQADAMMRAVMPEFAWHMQTAALSRGGLADLVEALGHAHRAGYLTGARVSLDEAARGDGEAILARLLGTKDASRTLAARAAGQCGVDAAQITSMLPHLAVIAVGGLALRSNADFGAVLAQVPPLGRLSRGSSHADLADILRRRCGAGAYSPRALPRAIRRAIAPAAAVASRSILVWYVRFMVGRPTARLLRSMVLSRGPIASVPAGH